jgi:hypothetical protein
MKLHFLGQIQQHCVQVVRDLPSVTHTEEDNILKEQIVYAPMPDHLLARGSSHFRKT